MRNWTQCQRMVNSARRNSEGRKVQRMKMTMHRVQVRQSHQLFQLKEKDHSRENWEQGFDWWTGTCGFNADEATAERMKIVSSIFRAYFDTMFSKCFSRAMKLSEINLTKIQRNIVKEGCSVYTLHFIYFLWFISLCNSAAQALERRPAQPSTPPSSPPSILSW